MISIGLLVSAIPRSCANCCLLNQGDLEWYTPDALKTEGGDLVITMTKERHNDLDYTSGEALR